MSVLKLRGVHEGCGLPPVPARAGGDRLDHLQVAEELGGRRARCRVLRPLAFTIGFQEQSRLIEDPLSYQRGSIPPGGIQLARFASAQLEPREDRGHSLADLDADARHRHQELHRDLGADLSPAHSLLNRIGQKLDQSEAARDPAHAPVEPPREVFEVVTEAALELGQQPALFQRRLLFGQPQRPVEHQGLSVTELPHRRAHRVVAEPAQGGDAFEAVDYLIAIRLARDRNDYDGHLLSRFGQRRQQLSLPLGMTRPQVFVAQVQLMELEIHPILQALQARKYAGGVSVLSELSLTAGDSRNMSGRSRKAGRARRASWTPLSLTATFELELALRSALHPAALPLQNALESPPALPRAEPLQGRAAIPRKGLVAPRSVAGAVEKIFL